MLLRRFIGAAESSTTMEGMRDLLRGSVGKTLHGLTAEDRIAAAWKVASGRALSERSAVVGFADGIVQVEVSDSAWLEQFMTIASQLRTEIARIAEVEVAAIHFELKKF